MRYQLIVKANPESSIAALNKRAAALSGPAPVIVGSHSGAPNETSLLVELEGGSRSEIELALNGWFLEPPRNPPFPIGALLHWSRAD
jgi:hypothetical protein